MDSRDKRATNKAQIISEIKIYYFTIYSVVLPVFNHCRIIKIHILLWKHAYLYRYQQIRGQLDFIRQNSWPPTCVGDPSVFSFLNSCSSSLKRGSMSKFLTCLFWCTLETLHSNFYAFICLS